MEGAEWLIVAVVVLLLFGSSQIPKFARSLGSAKKEYERGLREGRDPDDEAVGGDDESGGAA